MAQLLIELFSEEIPARMQLQAARDFERLFDSKLKIHGLGYDTLKAYVGPRRLSLHVEGLPLEHPSLTEEIKGPKDTAPPQALEGFLRKVGLSQDQLIIEGGIYLARITKPAQHTQSLLVPILEDVILNFPWPKSMRSGSSHFKWVRPLKRILCLFDLKIVPFEIEGLIASNLTEGHRHLGSGDVFEVSDFNGYIKGLRDNFVILDHIERQSLILGEANKVCAAEGCALIEDHGLLEEVAGLNEWPVPLLGDMDPKFLSLPPEVIKTSMRTHQKYFAVRDLSSGKMAAKFLVVSNLLAKDGGIEIKRGNAKVLSARLSDAVFFWGEDNRKGNFEAWLDKLNGVTFHAKLGTLRQRVARIEALALALAPYLRVDKDLAAQAARLAKADLASYMVSEFPELQGVMGGYYAEALNLPRDVTRAIRDHYKPQGPSDSVPEGTVSAVIALADKLDTLIGFFAIDEKPTGSKDPFALRRAALGMVRILRQHEVRLSLKDMVGLWYQTLMSFAGPDRAVYVDTENWRGSAGPRWDQVDSDSYANYLRDFRQGLLEGEVYVIETDRDHDLDIQYEHVSISQKPEKIIFNFRNYQTVSTEFSEFFTDRLKVMLKDEGLRYDLIEAALAVRDDDVVRTLLRLQALETVLKSEAGDALLAAHTRVSNILSAEAKKGTLPQGDITYSTPPPEVETALYHATLTLDSVLDKHLEAEAFEAGLLASSDLRPLIDSFLDGVLVNASDPKERAARLLLLGRINNLLGRVVDLSKVTKR
jgi:glycyl-tRNA synthetase beta chain